MVFLRTKSVPYDKQLPLYYLAFFSKHETGLKFWDQVRKYATDQLSLL